MQGHRRNSTGEKHTGTVQIGTLFEKYKTRLRPPQGIVISTFCALVATELGIPLASAHVRYEIYSRTISVTVSGPQKSEILFNKARILTLCRASLGDLGAPKHIV